MLVSMQLSGAHGRGQSTGALLLPVEAAVAGEPGRALARDDEEQRRRHRLGPEIAPCDGTAKTSAWSLLPWLDTPGGRMPRLPEWWRGSRVAIASPTTWPTIPTLAIDSPIPAETSSVCASTTRR